QEPREGQPFTPRSLEDGLAPPSIARLPQEEPSIALRSDYREAGVTALRRRCIRGTTPRFSRKLSKRATTNAMDRARVRATSLTLCTTHKGSDGRPQSGGGKLRTY